MSESYICKNSDTIKQLELNFVFINGEICLIA